MTIEQPPTLGGALGQLEHYRQARGATATPFGPAMAQANRGRRKAGASWSQERRQDFLKVAGVDSFEVEVRDQLRDTLGLPQVLQQELAGESFALALWTAIVHARLLHRQFANRRDQLPLGQVTVAHDLAVALLVLHLLLLVDPLGDLRLLR